MTIIMTVVKRTALAIHDYGFRGLLGARAIAAAAVTTYAAGLTS